MEEETPVLAGGKQNTGAAPTHLRSHAQVVPSCSPNPSCSPEILPAPCPFLVPVPGAGMRASTEGVLTASLTVLSQNRECCKHSSASPCFQHSCQQRSLGSLFLFFFAPNQRNLLQISPSQNCAMTFSQLGEDHSSFVPCLHCLWQVTGAGCHLSMEIPPPRMVLTWWHRAGAAMAGVVLPGQWQAWELCTATPSSRQTWRGKANWVYLTNCLTNQHLFLREGKWEWVNTPNSFEAKWLLTFGQTRPSLLFPGSLPAATFPLQSVPKTTYTASGRGMQPFRETSSLSLLSLKRTWMWSDFPFLSHSLERALFRVIPSLLLSQSPSSGLKLWSTCSDGCQGIALECFSWLGNPSRHNTRSAANKYHSTT